MTVLQTLAMLLEQSIDALTKYNDGSSVERCQRRIRQIVDDFMPSALGIDSGTTLIRGQSDRLVFEANFYHMNDVGRYNGWTEHKIIVTPSFIYPAGKIRITGRDCNQIKGYLCEIYEMALSQEIYFDTKKGRYVLEVA